MTRRLREIDALGSTTGAGIGALCMTGAGIGAAIGIEAHPQAGASQPQAGSEAHPQAGASQPQAGSEAHPQAGASQPQAGSAEQPQGEATSQPQGAASQQLLLFLQLNNLLSKPPHFFLGEQQPLSQEGASQQVGASQPQAGSATSQPQGAASQQLLLFLQLNNLLSRPPHFFLGEQQPLSQEGASQQVGTSQPQAGSAAQPQAGASQPQAGSAAQPQGAGSISQQLGAPQGASHPQAGSAAQPQSVPQGEATSQPHAGSHPMSHPVSQQLLAPPQLGIPSIRSKRSKPYDWLLNAQPITIATIIAVRFIELVLPYYSFCGCKIH